jgi:hypothetical protein
VKALTLWQPWATLIAEGVKTIETRSWATSHRGPVAIHAAATEKPMRDLWRASVQFHEPAATQVIDALDAALGWDDWHYEAMAGTLGAVVATANLVDVIGMTAWRDEPRGGRWEYAVICPPGEWHSRRVFLRENNALTSARVDDIDISSQLPFGDFRPGRYAWLLDDIVRLDEPIPARGAQQLWDWDEEVLTGG